MSRTLTDPFGRTIEYVRLSVTDRCDLRCFYCMPKGFKDFEEPEHWLSFDEIERVIAAFARLGTKRIRITGGEPLVRKDLPALAARLSALPGIDDLSLSHQCHAAGETRRRSATRRHPPHQCQPRLPRSERFKDITGGKLDKVLDGLMAAKAAGFAPIKINMVVMKGVNEDEVEDDGRLLHRARLHPALHRDHADGRHRALGHGSVRRPADGEGAPRRTLRTAAGGDAGRRTRALRARRRHRSAHRLHHPDLAALLRDLQPRAPGGRRHAVHVPGPGTQASNCARCCARA
jgi:hypothetical protein